MTRTPDRKKTVILVNEAVKAGARRAKVCEEIGISLRTLQRWTQTGEVSGDMRPNAKRSSSPGNKLSEDERKMIIQVLNRAEYRSLPPSQVVPALADKGIYIASESTMYRVLQENSMQRHRGRGKEPKSRQIAGHAATAPNKVWSWDITWLPGPAKGLYLFLYMIIDIFSRKIVGWEVYESESSEHASEIFMRASLKERPGMAPLVVHSDNGSPMKGSSLLATMYNLGIEPSYSRPGVSNDNPYSESLFRTLKYRPSYPYKGFASIEDARKWCMKFTFWYNNEHRHRNLNFITPAERHDGRADEIFAKRRKVYEEAKKKNPSRWIRNTRNWSLKDVVWLNAKSNRETHAENAKSSTKNLRQVA